ncbi:MAG: protein translocase subunit SecD, partial [Flavobacteriales bacterium]
YLFQGAFNGTSYEYGGMSVVLEVSIADLFVALSDNHPSPEFRKSIEEAKAGQKNSSKAFVDLFDDAWKRNNTAGLELWKIFNNIDTKDKFKPKSTDDEVIEVLRFEAEDALNNTENIIKKRIEPFGITQANVIRQSLTGRIIVELPGVDDPERVRKMLGATANLEFWETYRAYEVYEKIVELEKSLSKVKAPDLQSKDPIRAEELEKQRKAVLDTPGANWKQADIDSINKVYRDTTLTPDSLLTDADKRRKYPLSYKKIDFSAIQAGTAVLGVARASDVEGLDSLIHGEIARQTLPGDLRLVWGAVKKNSSELYAIQDKSMRGKAELDGSSIVNAREGVDPLTGDVEVTMMMDGPGTVKWREMTARNKPQNQQPGRQVAIVMDNRVYSAPVVNEEIPNGSSRITMGNGDGVDDSKLRDEAKDLAELLKSGSLPAPAKIIDEVTVGPSIGEENITSGMWSFIIAFVLILIYMMFYYAWAGWAANVALIANLFFMFGALVAMHGSLTLPGIAGIVLTMGMAVDANVLIYERVKEELRNGSNMAAAMKDGFIKALSAILDGNATTLITGIILFIVGTGPIKGFATTLIIGIFTTLLTALIVSRLILYNRLERKRP